MGCHFQSNLPGLHIGLNQPYMRGCPKADYPKTSGQGREQTGFLQNLIG